MAVDASSELTQIATRLDQLARRSREAEVAHALDKLQASAEEAGKAASGSWLGYHAYVYYGQVEPSPPGAHFDAMWGLTEGSFSSRTSGTWIEYGPDAIVATIHRRAGNPDLAPARMFDNEAREEVARSRSNVLSIIQVHQDRDDQYLESIRKRVDEMTSMGQAEVVWELAPKAKSFTHDGLALSQGLQVPPHLKVLAEVIAIHRTRVNVEDMIKIVNELDAHLSRLALPISRPTTGNIFIGHGRSAVWRELKDLIEDELGLSTDEFNRVPVAGATIAERLEEMLNTATMAFLVMTGEDEQPDGRLHARLNVVHEAGLFQGRLGFDRAILLLEHGCDEFTNIAGLVQLRFPKGEIKSVFEDVRGVLKREGLLGGLTDRISVA